MDVKLNRDHRQTGATPWSVSFSKIDVKTHKSNNSFQDESHDILVKFCEIHPWLVFMVNEGKTTNKTKKIELPQFPDEKLQSSSESFQLNDTKVTSDKTCFLRHHCIQQLWHLYPVWFLTWNEENQLQNLMNGNETIYKARNGMYMEKNKRFTQARTSQLMQTLAQTPFVPSDHDHTQTVQFSARNRELGNDWDKEQKKEIKQSKQRWSVLMFVNRLEFSFLIGQCDVSCEC